MSIDWITVAAQTINFLVLVWLLQRFLYAPITNAMELREARIQERIDEAARMKDQAGEEAGRLKIELAVLDREREQMLAEARGEAARLRHMLEAQERLEITELREVWRREFESEQEAFVHGMRREAVGQFFALSREALGGLANKTLNDAIGEGFAARLAESDQEQLTKLRTAVQHGKQNVHVFSSFELGAVVKRHITKTIQELLSADVAVDYAIDESLICGVKMMAHGQTVTWSLESYLDRLEKRMLLALDDAKPGSVKTVAE